MSDDTTPDTEVHLDTDLLELDKRVSRSSTDYPVFEYRFDYNGSPPGELTISESLPPGVGPDDVEFHPDFYGENWTCTEERIEFAYILPDSEVVETKFGLSIDDAEITEALAGPPVVLVDDLETGDRIAAYEPSDAETLTPEDGEGMQPVEPDPVSDTVRDIILGSKEDVTGGDDESDDTEEPLVVEAGGADAGDSVATSTAGTPEAAVSAGAGDGDDADGSSTVATPPSETDDVDEGVGPGEDATEDGPVADGPVAPDDATPTGLPTDDDGTEPSTDDGTDTAADDHASGDGASGDGAVGGAAPASVGQALAEELRAGTIPEDDLDVLREHLDVGLSESDRVRLEDLQSRYHDLLAYTDALEAFIDEHGDADGVLSELQSDVAGVEDELERLSEVGERVEEDLAAYPDADDLQDRLDDLASELNDTQETVESELADISGELSDLEATVEELEDQTEVLLELKEVFGPD